MSYLDKLDLTTWSSIEDIKKAFSKQNTQLEVDLGTIQEVKKFLSEEDLKKYTEEFSPYPFFLYAYITKASDIKIMPYPEWKDSEVWIKSDWNWDKGVFKFKAELHNQYINAIKNWWIKGSWNSKTENQKIPQDWKWILEVINNKKEIINTIQLRLAFVPTPITDSKNTPLETCVIRLLDNQWNPDLEDAWFNIFDYEKILTLQKLKKWLVLISWPTWSWKSSTLFWFIDKVNDWTKNIFTMENPVEFSVPWITQIEVLPIEDITDDDEVTCNFTRTESFLMRAAPDIILVWEIRDYQTSKTATTMSLTWHLTLWTLHTNSAIATLARLFWFKSKDWDKLDRISIIDSLEYVSAQMLSKKVCPHCRIKVKDIKINTGDKVLDKLNQKMLDDITLQTPLIIRELTRPNIQKILGKLTEEKIKEWINESYLPNFNWCEHCSIREDKSLDPKEKVGYKWRLMLNETILFDSYIKELLTDEKITNRQILNSLLEERPLLTKEHKHYIKNHTERFVTLYQDALFKALLPMALLKQIVPWSKIERPISVLDSKTSWYVEI